jgi:hypothetical protein
MNNKQVQTSQNKVPKKNNSNVPSHLNTLPVFNVRKEINPMALLMFLTVWTVAIGQISYYFATKSSHGGVTKKDLEQLELRMQELANANANVGYEGFDRDRVDSAREMAKLREQIIEEVNRLNNQYQDLIIAKDQKNIRAMQDLIVRGPASLGKKEGKVLTYSSKNADVFSYKLRLEYKRVKKELEEEKRKFMSKLNLNRESDRKRLEQFNDDIKVKLYELDAHHRSLKYKFRKQKYIIVNNASQY